MAKRIAGNPPNPLAPARAAKLRENYNLAIRAGLSPKEAMALRTSTERTAAAVGLSVERAKVAGQMAAAIQRAKREYKKGTPAYEASRVDPKNAIGRLETMLRSLLAEPDKLTPRNGELFDRAADTGASMRGEINPNVVRYTPERKAGNADPAYTLWVDELEGEPDDAPGYGTYDERG